MKKHYQTPSITVNNIAPQTVLMGGSMNVDPNEPHESDAPEIRHRGGWGDLWSDED